MPKVPSFTPKLTDRGWSVSIPPTFTGSGKRERRFFSDPKLAERFAGALRSKLRSGQIGGVIPYDLALDAAKAIEILKPHGLTLLDAAKEVAARIEKAGTSETFAERHAAVMLANEARWRQNYMESIEKMARWLPDWFMATQCNLIDKEVIGRALDGPTARSTKDLRGRYISAVLGHRERHHKSEHIEILTPEQVDVLLRACESKEEAWAIALLLFAGIRPDSQSGEISKLDWSDVGKDEIYISPGIAKTGTDRHIPITPRLRRMLNGHPKSGTVVPSNWKKVHQRLRKAAGITASDVLRHTFASNYLAAYGEKACKDAMGHTAGSSVLFRHYRRSITEEAGKQFFR
jgi:integrase